MTEAVWTMAVEAVDAAADGVAGAADAGPADGLVEPQAVTATGTKARARAARLTRISIPPLALPRRTPRQLATRSGYASGRRRPALQSNAARMPAIPSACGNQP